MLRQDVSVTSLVRHDLRLLGIEISGYGGGKHADLYGYRSILKMAAGPKLEPVEWELGPEKMSLWEQCRQSLSLAYDEDTTLNARIVRCVSFLLLEIDEVQEQVFSFVSKRTR